MQFGFKINIVWTHLQRTNLIPLYIKSLEKARCGQKVQQKCDWIVLLFWPLKDIIPKSEKIKLAQAW